MKSITWPLALSCVGGALSLPAQGAAKAKQNQQRPNILFCIADDASFHHFGANGCSWVNTPAFDRVANEGVRFARCYTPNAKSAPSRSCILTGRNSWQLKEAGNHVGNFPAEFKVFTEALADAGYTVAYTGKGWAPGNPGTVNGKKRELTGKPYNARKLTPPAQYVSPVDYAGNFVDFLDEVEGKDTPWFFWYGSKEPHRAYEYGVGQRLAGKDPSMVDHVPAYYPDQDTIRMDLLDYAFEIEYYDSHIGKMLDELERRGLLDNTLVVVTSDNGMPFPRGKGNDYEYSNHMPLAMMWKAGITDEGRTEMGYVSFIDFAPTFLELAGMPQEQSGMQTITGRSLADVLRNNQNAEARESRESVLLGRERHDYGRPGNQGYPIRAILRDNLLYVVNLKPWLYPAGNPLVGYPDCDGSPTKTVLLNLYRSGQGEEYWQYSFGFRPDEELYDLSKDMDCMENLAGKPAYELVRRELRQELFDRLMAQEDPRMLGHGDDFDQYPFDEAKKENFYERVQSGEVAEPWKQTGWISPTDYDSYIEQVKAGKVKPYGRKAHAQ